MRELAAESGCRGLLIGFETLNPQALREMKKGFNLKQDYYEVMRRFHEYIVKGAFNNSVTSGNAYFQRIFFTSINQLLLSRPLTLHCR